MLSTSKFQIGEEPLYCEAIHDEVLYSGSDDDYYEAPEARRLRIEAKAVQFLCTGNAPYLLSAKLEGPFEADSWNNPWKSKRTQRDVEVARGPAPGKTSQDLPDTQKTGTSLFPLPSPEITNPPSGRRNLYMDQDDFNRVKRWREEVKSIPLTKDPFWASQRAGSQGAVNTKKRNADQEWLHKREPKKHKSLEPRISPRVESPSQTASKTKRQQPRRFSEFMTQSTQAFSTHEDELATQRNAVLASFDASRLANVPMVTSGSTRTARNSKHSKRRLQPQEPESSEDELSMPSTTPAGRAGRSSAANSRSPAGYKSPSRRKKSIKQGSASIDQSPQPSADRVHVDQSRSSQLLCSQNPGAREVNAVCMGAESKNMATNNARSPTSKMDVDSRSPPRYTEAINEAVVSRQDEAGKDNPNDHETRTADTSEIFKQFASVQGPQTCGLDVNRIDADSEWSTYIQTQELSPVPISKGCKSTEVQNQAVEEVAGTILMTTDLNESNSEWSTFIETQDLLNISPGVEFNTETIGQRQAVPDPEWTVPVGTNELPIAYGNENMVSENDDGFIVVEQGSDEPSHSEWSTALNTQDEIGYQDRDSQRPAVKCEATTDKDAAEVGPKAVAAEDGSNSEWSSYTDTTSQVSADQTGDTSHEAVLTKASVSEERPSQDSVGCIINAYAEIDQSSADLQKGQGNSTPNENLQPTFECCMSTAIEMAAKSTPQMEQDEHYRLASKHSECDKITQTQSEPVSAYPSIVPNVLDKCTVSVLPSYGQIQIESDTVSLPRAIGTQEYSADGTDTPKILHEPPARVKKSQVQSPWNKEESFDNHTPVAVPMIDYEIANKTDDSIRIVPIQSPWVSRGIDMYAPTALQTDPNLKDSTSNLSALAGKALALSGLQPQTPWMGERFSGPNFSFSFKKFSDFKDLSPTKQRNISSGSVLRSSGTQSAVLFKTPVPMKKRRVVFAPLPGENEADVEMELGDKDLGLEEDISYYDTTGRKTANIRVPKPTTKPLSPPPSNLKCFEADDVPDYPKGFSKHFEVVSKQKGKHPRGAPRLLPSDSQQTNGSQDAGAMAEAFIQASQTRKKSVERNDVVADDNSTSPIITDSLEEQENIEPVDDVSAVLDNLDDFLDNTWGVDMKMDVDGETEDAQPAKCVLSQGVRRSFDSLGDPMSALNINVWAD